MAAISDEVGPSARAGLHVVVSGDHLQAPPAHMQLTPAGAAAGAFFNLTTPKQKKAALDIIRGMSGRLADVASLLSAVLRQWEARREELQASERAAAAAEAPLVLHQVPVVEVEEAAAPDDGADQFANKIDAFFRAVPLLLHDNQALQM